MAVTHDARAELEKALEDVSLFTWAIDKPTRDEFRKAMKTLRLALSAVVFPQPPQEEHHPNCEVTFATCTCEQEQKKATRVDEHTVIPPERATAAENETKDATAPLANGEWLGWSVELRWERWRVEDGRTIRDLWAGHYHPTVGRHDAEAIYEAADRAMRMRRTSGDGITPGEDSAGSGVPRTVNGEARDKASSSSSAADVPLPAAPDLKAAVAILQEEMARDINETMAEALQRGLQRILDAALQADARPPWQPKRE